MGDAFHATCSKCGAQAFDVDPVQGFIACEACGHVLEEAVPLQEETFAGPGDGGELPPRTLVDENGQPYLTSAFLPAGRGGLATDSKWEGLAADGAGASCSSPLVQARR